jgi:predicted membrane chloride channel (bestrophin family)
MVSWQKATACWHHNLLTLRSRTRLLTPQPKGWPGTQNVTLSTPINMITFALALLLVFKTNASYSRWWEGRVVWGQLVNFGRNLPRLVRDRLVRDRPAA